MLALKVVFGKLLPVPKLCKKIFSTMCSYDDGNSVFRGKKTTICNAKFGDLGDNDLKQRCRLSGHAICLMKRIADLFQTIQKPFITCVRAQGGHSNIRLINLLNAYHCSVAS